MTAVPDFIPEAVCYLKLPAPTMSGGLNKETPRWGNKAALFCVLWNRSVFLWFAGLLTMPFYLANN